MTVSVVTVALLLPWVALAIATRRRFGPGVETKLAVVALVAAVMVLAPNLVEALGPNGHIVVPIAFLFFEVVAIGFLAWVLAGPVKTTVRPDLPLRPGGPPRWGKATGGRAAALQAMLLEGGRRRRRGPRTRRYVVLDLKAEPNGPDPKRGR